MTESPQQVSAHSCISWSCKVAAGWALSFCNFVQKWEKPVLYSDRAAWTSNPNPDFCIPPQPLATPFICHWPGASQLCEQPWQHWHWEVSQPLSWLWWESSCLLLGCAAHGHAFINRAAAKLGDKQKMDLRLRKIWIICCFTQLNHSTEHREPRIFKGPSKILELLLKNHFEGKDTIEVLLKPLCQ